MNYVREIFGLRIKKENEEKARYNKYIFNSHLIIFILILSGGIMINYSSWLAVAKTQQLQLVLMTIFLVMSYTLTNMSIKTYIKDADSIFLLPLEKAYTRNIPKLILPSVIIRIFWFIFFLALAYPIINKLGISYRYTAVYVVVTILLIRLYVDYLYKKIIFHKIVFLDKFIILILLYTTSILYTFTLNIVILPLLLATFIFKYKTKMLSSINWEGAAKYDNLRREKYLKFVNMFVDVPIEIVKVSRRKYFDIFLKKLSDKQFKQENSYSYYYIRAFLRQENTIFLIIRLAIVALIFMVSFSNVYANTIIIIIFNYLSIIQLTPLYKKLNASIWFYLLPVNDKIKIKSFKKFILIVLQLVTIVLVLAAIIITHKQWYYLGMSLLVSYAIISYFLNKHIK